MPHVKFVPALNKSIQANFNVALREGRIFLKKLRPEWWGECFFYFSKEIACSGIREKCPKKMNTFRK